jgi:acyl-coenzyme A synthetase/AMP-(fatty) acid ligase
VRETITMPTESTATESTLRKDGRRGRGTGSRRGAQAATLFRDLIRRSARDPAHRLSELVDSRHACTYPDIPRRLDSIQRFFAERSVLPDDCVTVEISNSLPSALTVLALLDGGYSVLLLPGADQGARVREGDLPAPAFCAWRVTVHEAANPNGLDDPADFLSVRPNSLFRSVAAPAAGSPPRIYGRTSGSLGAAKLAVHSYERVRDNAQRAMERLRLDASCRIALPSPIFHLYAVRAAFLSGIAAGASIDFQQRANLLRYFEREREFDPNVAFFTPTFCETLLRVRKAPRPYRFVVIGGDRMDEFTRKASERLHGPLINAYGSTEMGLISLGDLSMPPELRAGTVGHPLPGIVTRLMPAAGMPSGEPAHLELQLRSPYAFHGYVDYDGRPLEMPSAFDGDWYCTHDLAREGPQGMLQILGRGDLSVNRNGRLLSFAELESQLRGLGEVVDAAVAAGPEDIRGRLLVAFCVARAGANLSQEALHALCVARLPAFAVPDRVVILPELPKLPNGKVDRRTLARLAESEPRRRGSPDTSA